MAVGICSPAAFELSFREARLWISGVCVCRVFRKRRPLVRMATTESQVRRPSPMLCGGTLCPSPALGGRPPWSTLPGPPGLLASCWEAPTQHWWAEERDRTLGPSACPTPSLLWQGAGRAGVHRHPQLPLAAPPPWGSRRALPHSPLALAGRGRSPASTSPAGPLGAAHPAPCVQVSPEQAQQSVPSPAATLADAHPG